MFWHYVITLSQREIPKTHSAELIIFCLNLEDNRKVIFIFKFMSYPQSPAPEKESQNGVVKTPRTANY